MGYEEAVLWESLLRERIRRLQQMHLNLSARIMLENERIQRKHMKIMTLVQLLATTTDRSQQMIISNRIRSLEQEIERERNLINQLEQQRSKVAMGIQSFMQEIQQVRKSIMEERARRQQYRQRPTSIRG